MIQLVLAGLSLTASVVAVIFARRAVKFADMAMVEAHRLEGILEAQLAKAGGDD